MFELIKKTNIQTINTILVSMFEKTGFSTKILTLKREQFSRDVHGDCKNVGVTSTSVLDFKKISRCTRMF